MPLILIADDNNESRYLLEVLLQRNGFETVTASNGSEALEIARVRRPDLIVSDILMPVMDGFALCKEWKSDVELNRIPFIFYTATYTEHEDVEFGLSLGADRFLIKPQDVDVLLQVFGEVLSKNGTRTRVPPELSLEEEMEFLRHHNEALFHKLEKKMADLEAVNRALQGEIEKRHLTEMSLRESEEKLRTLLDTLQKAHDELEKRVEERTTELQRSYNLLKEETRERERLETQLLHAQKMQALGTLAGGIAHDFNNMLAVIIGNAEMAYDDLKADAGPRQNIQQILTASMRTRDLVKQILAFSRKTEGERNPIRLKRLIEETMKLLGGSLPSTIRMERNFLTESDVILGDSAQIQQVLINLATNAAYAMGESGGTLTIGLSDVILRQDTQMPDSDMSSGRYLKLTVSDTGIGMRNDVVKRVFDPFFTTKEVGQGTGMGLPAAYGIVKSHGGAITAESTPGKGSVFSVLLPHASPSGRDETEEGEDYVLRGKERILLVDDEPLIVETASKTLERLGYEVTTALSGSAALEIFQKEPDRFDLVITDQIMPDLTGIDLAARMLETRKELPIILVTGYSEMVSVEKARSIGIKEFVMKPIIRKELAETIRRAIDVGK